MFHFSLLHVFLLPSWVVDVKMNNGHQQGVIIDGADICGSTFQAPANIPCWDISFLSAETLLCVSVFISCTYKPIRTHSPPDSLIFSLSLTHTLFVCVSDREQ